MTLKEQIDETKEKTKEWIKEHQADIVYGFYIAACIGGIVIPIIRKTRKDNYDYSRDRRIYDQSNGFYWETKRKLTNNQKMIIEQRHMMGEPYGTILSDMNLLKR